MQQLWPLLLAAAALAVPAMAAEPDMDLARRAYQFAFPVYEVARTRWETVGSGAGEQPPHANTLVHKRDLDDASSRWVTTPNNDTLYSNAFLDLRNNPVELTVPASSGRYLSIALLDLFTDNFAILHPDEAGADARYLIVGPGWSGTPPEDVRLVRATTDDVWLLVRVFAAGPEDLAAAHAVQDGLRLEAASAALRPTQAAVPNAPTPAVFLDVVNEMLGRTSLPAELVGRIAPFEPLGVRPGATAVWRSLPPHVQRFWEDALPRLKAELRPSLAAKGGRAGWIYPRPQLGRFGDDDRFRATVALSGLGALPLEEAIYATAVADVDGELLDGAKSYRVTLPARVPVKAFWSLSMYSVDPQGRLYFVGNPIDRYAIRSRTPDLRRNPDGSLTVLIQRARPADARNWLPAPAGPFRLVFRGYLPDRSFLEGRFGLPAVECVDGAS